MDEETYREMMDAELPHCNICGKVIDDEYASYCPECTSRYYSIDKAIAYQRDSGETETIEVPALWTYLLSDTEILAELEKAFYRAVELDRAYLPKRLSKAAKAYMTDMDFEDWAVAQEKEEE